MAPAGIRVAALATTPVKGLRIASRSSIVLESNGIGGDRLLYLIDDRGRMINGKHSGALNQVTAALEDGRLRLALPSGEVLDGELECGEIVESTIHSRPRPARVLGGPFAEALSAHCGRPLRLVAAADGSSAIDRGAEGAVSLISRASLASLARSAGHGRIDARRFRMSIELMGPEPFEEDGWLGRELAVGTARVAIVGHVGRCIVTSRHPESGEADLPTLDRLREIRAAAATTEPLALGVYGAVSRPGVVSVGDTVEVLRRDSGPRGGSHSG
jgi:uncharacterized protein